MFENDGRVDMLKTYPCSTRYLPQLGQFAKRFLTASGVIYMIYHADIKTHR